MPKNAVIRVLLLEDDAGDARLLQMTLEQVAPGQFLLTTAPRLSEALKLLVKGPFDLVLTDLDVPDSRGLGTFLQIHAQVPHIPIMVLTGLADEEVGVLAVQKGAQDYLLKGQVNGQALVRSFRHALERHKRQEEQEQAQDFKSGLVVGFLGAKGGVGTTTVAVNVAATLARQDKCVIAVELRACFGTLALHLRRSPPAANLRHILELGAGHLHERELRPRLSGAVAGLRVLFGPQRPEEFKEIEPGQAVTLIDELKRMADLIVLDLPCQPSDASRAAVQRCDYVVLVVEREPASLAAGGVALELLRSWDVGQGRVGAILVNRVPLSVTIKLSDVRSALACDIVGVVPAAADACAEAQQAATPLVVFQPQNATALALAEIAGRLVMEPVPSVPVG